MYGYWNVYFNSVFGAGETTPDGEMEWAAADSIEWAAADAIEWS